MIDADQCGPRPRARTFTRERTNGSQDHGPLPGALGERRRLQTPAGQGRRRHVVAARRRLPRRRRGDDRAAQAARGPDSWPLGLRQPAATGRLEAGRGRRRNRARGLGVRGYQRRAADRAEHQERAHAPRHRALHRAEESRAAVPPQEGDHDMTSDTAERAARRAAREEEERRSDEADAARRAEKERQLREARRNMPTVYVASWIASSVFRNNVAFGPRPGLRGDWDSLREARLKELELV